MLYFLIPLLFHLPNFLGWLKAVNSEAKPIYGVAHGVELQIGAWKGGPLKALIHQF